MEGKGTLPFLTRYSNPQPSQAAFPLCSVNQARVRQKASMDTSYKMLSVLVYYSEKVKHLMSYKALKEGLGAGGLSLSCDSKQFFR